jgi:hypothetical protein
VQHGVWIAVALYKCVSNVEDGFEEKVEQAEKGCKGTYHRSDGLNDPIACLEKTERCMHDVG